RQSLEILPALEIRLQRVEGESLLQQVQLEQLRSVLHREGPVVLDILPPRSLRLPVLQQGLRLRLPVGEVAIRTLLVALLPALEGARERGEVGARVLPA